MNEFQVGRRYGARALQPANTSLTQEVRGTVGTACREYACHSYLAESGDASSIATIQTFAEHVQRSAEVTLNFQRSRSRSTRPQNGRHRTCTDEPEYTVQYSGRDELPTHTLQWLQQQTVLDYS